MALTLPYPGMVFVPLDILTAEQQNRIVANYTYISNQFPIASSNIDYTTLKKWVPDYANAQSIQNPMDYTAAADGFVIVGYAKYSANQSQSPIITVRIDNVIVGKITIGPTDRGGYPQCSFTALLPICTGQRLTSDAAGDMVNYGYFIPGKWV